LALLFAATLLAQSSITLQSPAEYQVFQRQSRTSGTIWVAGHAGVDGDAIEARASGDWQPIPFDRGSRVFRGPLPAAAGGWYEFGLRLRKSGQTVAEMRIPHVGIGEVFVIAGQSNSTNYGEVKQRTRTGMVAALGPNGWALADDPQPGVQDSSRNGSFIPPFGDALFEKYRIPIGVAAAGHGSTSVRQWLPEGERFERQPTMTKFVHPAPGGGWESDGTLFDGMMKVVRQFGPQGFRALLWHQGESDANQQPGHEISGGDYARLLTRLIDASHRQAGWDFPWFVAQASYHSPADTGSAEIRDAQESLWKSGIALEGPDTDQLGGDNRQNGGRGVHFNDKGLQAHGRLWAAKVGAYLDSVLK